MVRHLIAAIKLAFNDTLEYPGFWVVPSSAQVKFRTRWKCRDVLTNMGHTPRGVFMTFMKGLCKCTLARWLIESHGGDFFFFFFSNSKPIRLHSLILLSASHGPRVHYSQCVRLTASILTNAVTCTYCTCTCMLCMLCQESKLTSKTFRRWKTKQKIDAHFRDGHY